MRSFPATPRTVHPLAVFAVVSTRTMLATVDQLVVNVAFPAIGGSLGASVPSLSWVLNGYSIVFAALRSNLDPEVGSCSVGSNRKRRAHPVADS